MLHRTIYKPDPSKLISNNPSVATVQCLITFAMKSTPQKMAIDFPMRFLVAFESGPTKTAKSMA